MSTIWTSREGFHDFILSSDSEYCSHDEKSSEIIRHVGICAKKLNLFEDKKSEYD